MSKRRKENKRIGSYSYTKFNELKLGDYKVNIIGVIKVCDPPTPSKTNKAHYSCYFELMDESETKLTCTMSDSNHDNLPGSPCYGDILCLRKVTMESCEGQLLVKTSTNTTWLLFSKKEDFKPSSNISTLSLGIAERNRLSELKTWASKQDISSPSPKRHQRAPSPDSKNKAADPSASASNTQSTACPKPGPSSTSPSDPSQSTAGTSIPATATPTVSVPRVSRPTKSRYYDTCVTKISQQMVGNKEAGVIGILKYFKPPAASRGNDCFTVLFLVDESQQNGGISCVIFNPHKDRLPVASRPGEVVMIKGLIINTFQGNLQGRGHENSLVGIFPADVSTPLPVKIGDWYDLKDKEKARIQQLRVWAAREEPFLINSKLEELSCANYCTTLCLVVRVSVGTQGAMVLTVCDGTQPKSPMADSGLLSILSHSPTMDQNYLQLTSTVYLSAGYKPQVIAGDVVQLVNVCMAKSKRPSPPEILNEVMELVIENDCEHQGSVSILPKDSPAVQEFRSCLSKLKPPQPQPPSSPTQTALALTTDVPMLSTVIHCEDLRHVTLVEIQKAPVGSMHVVEVQVIGVGKAVCSRLEDICQLRCSGCKTLYMTPHPRVPDSNQLLTAGDMCVSCSADSLHEPNRLEYMYGFTLLITDHRTQMEVAVSGAEGKRFFSQMKIGPTNLYMDSEARNLHRTLLERMTGGTDPFHGGSVDTTSLQRPSLNLCITVFLSFTRKRGYKIANTNLCNL